MASMLSNTTVQHHFSAYRPSVATNDPVVLCRTCEAAHRQARWLRSCGAKVQQCQCCGQPRETWVYLIAALPSVVAALTTPEAR